MHIGKIRIYSKRKGGLNPPKEDGINYTIDRSNSTFGNPFELENIFSEEDRVECISKYKEYIENKITNEARTQKELLKLRNIVESGKNLNLICWCKRDDVEVPCHGDVLKNILEDLIK